MTIPNLITFARLGLVPVFAWALLAGRPGLAFGAFLTAAISDSLDGFLARVLHQQSRLGAILDPVADKLLGLTALVLLVAQGLLPGWLLGLSILRDAVVLGVGVTSRVTGRPVEAAPTRIGKYATFATLTTVTLSLIAAAFGGSTPAREYVATAGLVSAECLVVASVQYGLLWRRVLLGREGSGGAGPGATGPRRATVG